MMGTRGSLGYISQDKFKGTYNHYDSYPDGLGQQVVDICKQVEDWDKARENYTKVRWVQEDSKPSKKQIEENLKWYDGNVSNQTPEDMYCLLRNAQGEAGLKAVLDGELLLQIDSSNFIKDSLFCEYAYIINFDEETLEFYQGFQHSPQENNRFGTRKSDGYYPCKKVGEFPLTEIPDDWQQQLFPEKEDE